MVPCLTSLGGQVVVLVDEDVGIDKPGAGAILLTDRGEAGQQFEKDIVMPAQAGTGEQDLERGAPLCPLTGFFARIMTPLEVSVLGTPVTVLAHEMEVEAPSVRRSGRIAKLHLRLV